MQRIAPRAAVERAARGLAIDGHHLPDPGRERGHEPAETGLEPDRIEQTEQAREGVVTWDPARQGEKPTQERLLRPTKFRHVDAGLRAGQSRRERNQQDLQEIVALGVAAARVGQIRKARPKPLHPAPPKLFGRMQTRTPRKTILQTPSAIPLGSAARVIAARNRKC